MGAVALMEVANVARPFMGMRRLGKTTAEPTPGPERALDGKLRQGEQQGRRAGGGSRNSSRIDTDDTDAKLGHLCRSVFIRELHYPSIPCRAGPSVLQR